ncbi:MAG TPA: DegT/DnrJ/EryC1/StrS family aminotransferase, partial [Candidatus Atribacteria bacterium]|nr:DegT/DnrJ/EryC1/StrS family aminotransferase [Candidatus Atribacteria bacterium]
MIWKIPLFKIYWTEEDIESITNVIKRGAYWATGPEIQEFEREISEYAGTKYAVAFNSGTSALHALLLAYDLKQGDEVIIPSFTFIATANAPLFVGAKPVFAEIDGKTYGLDPENVKEKITKGTKAIMLMHYGGCPCLYTKELKEIAEDHNLLLIEDAAESLGAKIKDKKVGTFGDSAMFSFCQNKVISTGEGGAITTDSKEIYEKLKLIRSHGRLETQDYFTSTGPMDYICLGYNFRMPTMIAALGISQIKKIDKIIKMRRDKAEYIRKKLSKIREITLPIPPYNYFHVYQMYTIRINDTKQTRDKLIQYLAEKGIMSKVYFDPIHLTYFYRNKFGFKKGDLPITEKISEQVLSLPLYPTLT